MKRKEASAGGSYIFIATVFHEGESFKEAWRVMVAGEIDAERLVLVNEMDINISLSPLYAWAPKGERTRCSVPRNRGPTTTPLASMSAEGMGPCVAVEGTTAVVFVTYVEKVLAPDLQCGQVAVMDNLTAHKD